MSLVKCKECGKEISNQATNCPNCGCPITPSLQNTPLQGNLPPMPQKKKSNRILIVALVVIAGFILIGIFASKGSSTSKQPNNNDNAVIDQSTDSSQQENKENELLGLNEESTLKDWSITVTNVEFLDKIPQSQYTSFQAKEGNKYFKIDCTVTNNGTDSNTFLPSVTLGSSVTAKVLYQNDYEYSPSNLLGNQDDLHDTTLNPLSSKEGIIVFEIPDSVVSSDEELILVLKAGRNEIKYKVR